MPAVDFSYLEGFVAHDRGIVREVLILFSDQARTWSQNLEAPSDDWRDMVHTIKGAARGVGANVLGDACAVAEAGSAADLPAVKAALDVAVAEIEAYQAAHP
jgi:hypothetical protein